jgi:hypothetical protein
MDPGREDLPLEAVKVVTVKAGEAKVVHVGTGIVLATLTRDRSGGEVSWDCYLGETEDRISVDETRAMAVESALDPGYHHPGKATLDRRGRVHRPLTEEEHRRARPEAWAWWDLVGPLFPVAPPPPPAKGRR